MNTTGSKVIPTLEDNPVVVTNTANAAAVRNAVIDLAKQYVDELATTRSPAIRRECTDLLIAATDLLAWSKKQWRLNVWNELTADGMEPEHGMDLINDISAQMVAETLIEARANAEK